MRYQTKEQSYLPPNLSGQVYNLPIKEYSPANLSGGVYNIPTKNFSPTGDSGSVFSAQANTSARLDSSVYNYNLSVNVSGSNANADDIANNVMSKIKRMDSQRLRKQVIS